MSKQEILDTIWDEMHFGTRDAFEFIDWLEEFIEKQLDES